MTAGAIAMRFGVLLLLSSFVALPSADAQSTERVYRVGFLTSGTASASAGMVDAFREGMRELGWVEGRNVAVEYRFAEGRFERLPDLAAELVRKKADVVVAATSAAVVAARNVAGTTPIVMVNVADPVGLGLVASLARPGGSITGLSYSFGSDVWGKQLQLLKEAVPAARRVGVLANPANPSLALQASSVRAAAQSLGLSLQVVEVSSIDEFDAAFAAMTRERAEVLLVLSDPLFGSHAERLAELTTRNRLPSVHGARSNVTAGGLLFYGPNLVYQLRQAAAYVDRILKGARPADLPVEQPTKFDLIVNLKTAKTLGLTIPQSLLLRADQIIE